MATDYSGTITTTGVAQIGVPDPDPIGAVRTGWFIQNTGAASITVNDMGTAGATTGVVVAAGVLYIAPYVTNNPISLYGTAANTYTLRTW